MLCVSLVNAVYLLYAIFAADYQSIQGHMATAKAKTI